MEVIDLPLSGLKLIKPDIYRDERGFFLETFQISRYYNEGFDYPFIQDNHSRSIEGVLRGLHYQEDQAKLVRCTNGVVYDVAVDIRKDSPTFGQHYGLYLYSSDCWQFYIPSGFAHGFCCITNVCDLEYKVTSHYDVKTEGSIIWNDIDLNIQWPIAQMGKLILSDKDKQSQSFAQYKNKD